eukprot:TRINITY_DN22234_c0_g1_i1.p1 TRINITY_DN22234_c0_g1~~TRINITY_DN22234_c0_g1_i1.p1  ORF type:complete len:335 (+),score=110.11 TRINITY_DN22234_c0_g1_i1:59-1006(+)
MQSHGGLPGRLVGELGEGPEAAVRSARFRADGKFLVSAHGDKLVRLWDVERVALAAPLRGHAAEAADAAFNSSGDRVASGGGDRCVILWDVAEARPVRYFRGHLGRVNCVTFGAEEDAVLCTAGDDGAARLWDARRKRGKGGGGEGDCVMALAGARGAVTSLHWRQYEVITGSADCCVRAYDIRRGLLTTDCVGAAVGCVAATRDGRVLLAASLDDTARVLDRPSGQLLNSFTGHRNSQHQVACRLTPSERQVYAGGEDGVVLFWDLISAQVVHSLRHNLPGGDEPAAVPAADFSAAGQVFVSGGSDGRLCLFTR